MAGSSAQFHEDKDELSPAAIERHRAIVSIMEEMEAVDWYDQRAEATGDGELRAILEHNRDEEKEHAAMALEWLRRHDSVWDAQLRTYLFTEGPILEAEEQATGDDGDAEAAPSPADGSLGIGSLRGEA